MDCIGYGVDEAKIQYLIGDTTMNENREEPDFIFHDTMSDYDRINYMYDAILLAEDVLNRAKKFRLKTVVDAGDDPREQWIDCIGYGVDINMIEMKVYKDRVVWLCNGHIIDMWIPECTCELTQYNIKKRDSDVKKQYGYMINQIDK